MHREVRTDDTGFGGIKVIQGKDFGYGVDSVLLAAFAAGETGCRGIRSGAKVADLGSGSGIIAFVISHKVPGTVITGIEKRTAAVEDASEACLINGLQDRVSFVCCDVNEVRGKHDHDAIVCNPPYFRKSSSASDNERADDRYTARHETTADIGGFIRAASSMLTAGGDLYLIHRPDRLADIITAMREYGIEPKDLQPVVPVHGAAANMVMIHGTAGAGPQLKFLPEIAVHTEDGGYTDTVLRIYERKQ